MDYLTQIIDSLASALQQIIAFLTEFFGSFGDITQMFNEARNIANSITEWVSGNVIPYIQPIFVYLTNFLIQAFDFLFNLAKDLLGKL